MDYAIPPCGNFLASEETSRIVATAILGDFTIGTQELTDSPIVLWSIPTVTQTSAFRVSGQWTGTATGFDTSDDLQVSTGSTKTECQGSGQQFSAMVAPPDDSRGIVRISIGCDVSIDEDNVYQSVEVPYNTIQAPRQISWVCTDSDTEIGVCCQRCF